MSRSLMVSDETYNLIRRAISEGLVKDANGNAVTKNAQVIEVLMANFMGIRMVSDSDRQLLADYGFTDIKQLDVYHLSIQQIPKEKRGPETMKRLRQAIVEVKINEFLAEFSHLTPDEVDKVMKKQEISLEQF